MPTQTKYRYDTKNAYRVPHKRTMLKEIPAAPEVVRMPRTQNHQMVKKAQRSKMGARKMFGIAVKVMCVFLLCCTVIYRFSVILESNAKLDEMKKEYEAVMSRNQAIQAKIDKSFEANTLEKIATTQLGMVKPDPSQIIYVDMQMADKGETSDEIAKAEEETTALMGAPGTLIRAFQMLK